MTVGALLPETGSELGSEVSAGGDSMVGGAVADGISSSR
jgi:hypothetical protein